MGGWLRFKKGGRRGIPPPPHMTMRKEVQIWSGNMRTNWAWIKTGLHFVETARGDIWRW